MKNPELTHIFSGGIGALRLVLATLFLGPGPSCTQSDDQERERLRLESVRKHGRERDLARITAVD